MPDRVAVKHLSLFGVRLGRKDLIDESLGADHVLIALRQGAPTRPTLTGVVAGLFAGGVAAAIYAAHCPDDSPLFVALWYSLGIAIVALVGGLAGRLALRW